MRGAIGHDEGRGLIKRHGGGHRNAAGRIQSDLLCHAAIAGRGDDPVTDLQPGDAFANRFNHAGHFTAR